MVDKDTEFNSSPIMLGWVTKLEKKKATYKVTISKKVAVGCALKHKQKIFGYFVNEDDRPVVKYFLDGLNRFREKED
jgi:hypothetical protein